MNFRKEITPQPSLSFFNHKLQMLQDSIVEELRSGMWQTYHIDHRLYNNSIGEMRITEWKELFPAITPIMPGFTYNVATRQMEEQRYTPKLFEANMSLFLSTVEEYFARFEGKRIGVHLSGGVDSSLIICLLHHFGIPFYLYGMVNDRYEFRTERRIQDILAPLGVRTTYVSIEEYPFYSELEYFPFHQIPDSYIKSFAADREIARAAAHDGVEVVLGGQGGDTLFVDALPMDGAGVSFNIGNEFIVPWSYDLIYKPLGVDLVSFYADTAIIDVLSNLRRGQGLDVSKLWARNMFRDFLPRELSEYPYVADFNGLSLWGLEHAKPVVKKLFEEAYDLMKHPIFSPERTKVMMETNVFSFDYHLYIDYCNRISMATWLHALFEH